MLPSLLNSGLGGQTAVARAYANWSRPGMAGYKVQLLAGNIKPVQVFSFDQSSKNAADIELVVDALEVATDMPWIELFVIVSGDGDFVPMIRPKTAATQEHPELKLYKASVNAFIKDDLARG